MTEELRKCANAFDIDIFNYKDRKNCECGVYMNSLTVLAEKHSNKLLSTWLSDKDSDIDDKNSCKNYEEMTDEEQYAYDRNPDISRVKSIVCKPINEDSYFNPVHYFWECAAKIAREYHITIIYSLKKNGCKYIVDDTSDPNMMYDLIPKPRFFNNLIKVNKRKYFPIQYDFEYMDSNMDLLDKLKIKVCGPKMPKISKDYYTFMMSEYSIDTYIDGLKDEIERYQKKKADNRTKTYMKLASKYVDRMAVNPVFNVLTDKEFDVAKLMLGLVYASFDKFPYTTTKSVTPIYQTGDEWYNIMKEVDWLLGYEIPDTVNDKSIAKIVDTLAEYNKDKEDGGQSCFDYLKDCHWRRNK